jgi:hypothetical protein
MAYTLKNDEDDVEGGDDDNDINASEGLAAFIFRVRMEAGRWYPTALLHGVTTQKTAFRITSVPDDRFINSVLRSTFDRHRFGD